MTLVTGTVQDLGYDGMEGTLWARPARFRSDGQVVLAPERKPYKITGGVVSAELAPGPAVLELQVGSHARGTFEVVIPEAAISLADLLDTVFPWEPEQVSLFVAEREAAQQAAADAAASAGTATSAAGEAEADRAHVDSIRQTLDEAAQSNVAPYLTQSELNATYALVADVTVTDKGTISPNVALGGLRNGSEILPTVSGGVLLNPGGVGYNNIIGGDGSTTVGTTTPNVTTPDTSANQSVIGGYDNVAGAVSSKIVSDHSFVGVDATKGHNAIFGGSDNKISGAGTGFAGIFAGKQCTVTADSGFATGVQNTVSGMASSAFGSQNTVAGNYSTVTGQSNSAPGAYARADGLSTTASGSYSQAAGRLSRARFAGQVSQAVGQFSAPGDAQQSRLVMHRAFTTATPTLLGIAGGSSSYQLQPNQSCTFTARIIARDTASNDAAGWTVAGTYTRGATGAPVAVGAPTITQTGASTGAATWAVTMVTSSIGDVGINFTGQDGKTIRAVMSFDVVEVIGA